MATSQVRKSGGDVSSKSDFKISGYVSDPGPYEATVVGIVEGSRLGQLLVNIPEWGGATTDIGTGDIDAIPASYASPFFGSTYGTDTQQAPDNPMTSGQSYGMWFVPPDIGNKVLVTFAAGDMSRCYWFACIYDTPSHHMVPGIARHIGGSNNTKDPSDALTPYLSADSVLPVVEVNTSDSKVFNADGLENTPRYPHEFQSMTLIKQGLDRDPIRGAISSSSLRESPSNVYGISTPGRKGTMTDQIEGRPQMVFFRKGGHQFVMDDGDADGNDQLMRLRTSGGHQVLMNDTKNILYIASSSGNQWLEFSENGQINVFGIGGFNLRSKGPINFHSDSAINMDAMSISMKSAMSTSIYSGGSLSLSSLISASIKSAGMATLSAMAKVSVTAGASLTLSAVGDTSVVGAMLRLNSGAPGIPLPPLPTLGKPHKDTEFLGKNWVANAKVLSSICTVVPAHEPWERPSK